MATLHLGNEDYDTSGTNGKVGVDTTSPDKLFSVAGDAIFGQDQAGNSKIVIGEEDASSKSGVVTWNATNETVDLRVCGATDPHGIYVKVDGHVGIGTTDPGNGMLHVESSSVMACVYTQNDYDSKTRRGQLANETSGLYGFASGGALQACYLDGCDSAYGLIVNAGNVGIGDTTPSYNLDVNGDIRVQSGSSYYHDSYQGANGYFYDKDNNKIRVRGGIITDLNE